VAKADALLRQATRRSGNLHLRCEPSDAVISLDGVVQGTCDDFAQRGLEVGEGLHSVEVAKEGYWPFQTVFQPSGARGALAVKLSPVEGGRAREASP
jgi:hypothetical protein